MVQTGLRYHGSKSVSAFLSRSCANASWAFTRGSAAATANVSYYGTNFASATVFYSDVDLRFSAKSLRRSAAAALETPSDQGSAASASH